MPSPTSRRLCNRCCAPKLPSGKSRSPLERKGRWRRRRRGARFGPALRARARYAEKSIRDSATRHFERRAEGREIDDALKKLDELAKREEESGPAATQWHPDCRAKMATGDVATRGASSSSNRWSSKWRKWPARAGRVRRAIGARQGGHSAASRTSGTQSQQSGQSSCGRPGAGRATGTRPLASSE